MFILIANSLYAQVEGPSSALLTDQMVFDEVDGVIPVEAEFFYKQEKNDVRYWVRQSAQEKSKVTQDPEGSNWHSASNLSYIEVLPDTRVTHDDKLVPGVSFSNVPGILATVHYKVNATVSGRYYVWARIHSTGAEDNGVHVGLNGEWPDHGQRMQWCQGKNEWTWASKQRTKEVHCGVLKEIYLDIERTGVQDIHFSMREDGFEFDKFILTKDSLYIPKGYGPASKLVSGELPKASSVREEKNIVYFDEVAKVRPDVRVMKAIDFPIENTNYYIHKNWLAVDPVKYKEAKTSLVFPHPDGMYDIIFVGVGESDGQSVYKVLFNNEEIIDYAVPLSEAMFEEGNSYNTLLENVRLNRGDTISVIARPASTDGKEYSRGRWAGIIFAPMTAGKGVINRAKTYSVTNNNGDVSTVKGFVNTSKSKNIKKPSYVNKNGKGDVVISGELKQWHKVNLTMDGPFATEMDMNPNPFTDYRMTVKFTHESGTPSYNVPGYFATDGNAAESGAVEGIKWRAHLSPDKAGIWNYEISFLAGAYVALADDIPWMKNVSLYHGIKGSFVVEPTDKTGRDFRAKGRLQYVGKHHLQFKGTGKYFFKTGTDAPETLLGYEDFDSTYTLKSDLPLKKFEPHLKDYQDGDPTWQGGKGKGLIGALNYLGSKGVNSVSFLTYNAGGDGENVWPFVSRDEKFHYDCSKLDQWQIVFDHAQSKGIHLHFKTQETENDDNVKVLTPMERIPESLDGGDLGPERRLYYRELIARFGYSLALNWNLGEENTQSTENQIAMAEYFMENDPYRHNVVLHTFPKLQEMIYTPLLGDKSELTGLSLQNEWHDVFEMTLHWVHESDAAGKPWVVANDEQGPADKGVPPDPGYKGFNAAKVGYNIHDIRKQTLWGNLMAGGAGVEYYFGYQLPENDLRMEDFRSRDRSWDFCKVAIDFLAEENIPFHEMKNKDGLIGNDDMGPDKHCFAKENEIYLVYLAYVSTSRLDLTGTSGTYRISWFNPVTGGSLQTGSIKKVKAGQVVDLGNPPFRSDQDWAVVIRKD